MKRCSECFVAEGELHKADCPVEECPHCGGQLIAHGNAVKRCAGSCVTLAPSRFVPSGTDYQRVPFLHFPRVCARCGKVNPRMFMVPDEEWRKYVPPSIRGGHDGLGGHLCLKCYNEIRGIQDASGGGGR